MCILLIQEKKTTHTQSVKLSAFFLVSLNLFVCVKFPKVFVSVSCYFRNVPFLFVIALISAFLRNIFFLSHFYIFSIQNVFKKTQKPDEKKSIEFFFTK